MVVEEVEAAAVVAEAEEVVVVHPEEVEAGEDSESAAVVSEGVVVLEGAAEVVAVGSDEEEVAAVAASEVVGAVEDLEDDKINKNMLFLYEISVRRVPLPFWPKLKLRFLIQLL